MRIERNLLGRWAWVVNELPAVGRRGKRKDVGSADEYADGVRQWPLGTHDGLHGNIS